MPLGFLPPKQQSGSSLGFLPPKQPNNTQMDVPSTPQSGFDKFGNNLKYAGKQNAPAWDTMGALSAAGRGIQEAGARGVSDFTKGVGNTVQAVGQGLDAVNPVNVFSNVTGIGKPSNVAQTFTKPVQQGANWVGDQPLQVQKKLGLNTNSVAGNLGGAAGSLAAQVPALIAGGNVTNAIKGAPVLKNAPNFIKGLLGDVGGGAVSTEGMTAATEGRIANPDELAAGGAIDIGANILSGGLSKLGKNAYEKVLGLTRGEKGKLAERGLDLGEALAEKGYVARSRESLSKKLGKDVKGLSGNLDQLVKKADAGNTNALVKLGQKAGVTAGDLIEGLRTKVLQSPKLKPKFGEIGNVEKQITSTLKEFEKTVGDRNKILTFEEVQNLKKKLGGSLSSLLSKSGDAKGTAKELGNDVIRSNSKKVIEDNVKGAKEINKKMAPLIEAKKVLKKKGDYSGYLTDALVGGSTLAGDLASGKKPEQIVQDVVVNLALKRGLSSVGGRTARGAVLSNAGKAIASPILKQGIKNLLPLFRSKSLKK